MPSRDERMLHSDAFAWYMEKDPALRSTVVAISRLDRPPDWDVLRYRVDRLTRLVPRLRMRVQVPPLRFAPPRWTVDETFDLDYHLRRIRLPEPGSWDQVLEFARQLAMDDFDRSRPLWEFTVVEGLADGGAAFVNKLHHSLTDGIGGIQLAALVIDAERDAAQPTDLPPLPAGHSISATTMATHSVGDNTTEAVRNIGRIALAAPATVGAAALHPLRVTRSGARAALSVYRFVAPVNRAESRLFRDRRMTRRLATMDVPFDALHDVAVAAGCHVNDAYLAALIDGVHRYHRRLGTPLEHMRLTIPVSLRRDGDGVGGNRITLIRIRVPATGPQPQQHIHAIAEVMRRWREEPALTHAQGIAQGLNLFPRWYLGGVLKRIELLASDVPGLPAEVYLARAKITGYYGFGPTIGAALNCTLMSYAGTCDIGVNIDTSAVQDPDLMLQCLHEAFSHLLVAGMPKKPPAKATPKPAVKAAKPLTKPSTRPPIKAAARRASHHAPTA